MHFSSQTMSPPRHDHHENQCESKARFSPTISVHHTGRSLATVEVSALRRSLLDTTANLKKMTIQGLRITMMKVESTRHEIENVVAGIRFEADSFAIHSCTMRFSPLNYSFLLITGVPLPSSRVVPSFRQIKRYTAGETSTGIDTESEHGLSKNIHRSQRYSRRSVQS